MFLIHVCRQILDRKNGEIEDLKKRYQQKIKEQDESISKLEKKGDDNLAVGYLHSFPLLYILVAEGFVSSSYLLISTAI